MNTTTRRAALAALAASGAALATSGPAEATRPMVNQYDRLTGRLGRIRYRLALRRRGEAPEVADLRRAVLALVAVVEDLVDLENPRAEEPRWP